MRHLLLAVVAAAAFSATAHAQRPTGGAAPTVTPSQGAAPTRTAPQHPSAPQVPAAPPVLFPLPPLMTPPAGGLTHRFPGFFSHGFDAREFSPSRRPRKIPPYGSYYIPGYIVPSEPDVPPEVPAAEEANGLLRLSVIPDRAQVFVDGYYVGTIADVAVRGGLWLPIGPHRLEFHAIGYRTAQIDVAIAPNETLSYQGELEFIQPATQEPPAPLAPAPPPAKGSTVMYLIPNCYLGNVPPRPSRMPAGCDINKVEILGRR
jgi:hypothetical protein